MPTPKSNRRQQLSDQKSSQQTLLFVGLFIVLFILIIFVGFPSLVKLAIFIGNIRNSNVPISQNDTIPPAAPQITTNYTATPSANININGYAEANSSVTLFHNGQKTEETISNPEGEFEFSNINLKSGLNNFQTTATDLAGNQSQKSPELNVLKDDTPPEINLLSPKDNQEFYGLNEQTVTISGETETNTQIKINDHYALVQANGSFTSRYQLQSGDNHLTIIAIDQAGNTSQQTLKLIYHP